MTNGIIGFEYKSEYSKLSGVWRNLNRLGVIYFLVVYCITKEMHFNRSFKTKIVTNSMCYPC